VLASDQSTNFSKKKILSILVIVMIVSLGFKLYLIDFSSLPVEDTYGYVIRAIAHTNGDFSENERKTLGWSIFLSPFMLLLDSNEPLDYINAARILSIIVSTITIYPMYLLARKFFNEKFSIAASCLFAFQPHLNYNSVQGISEPLFILLSILSFYFILHQDNRVKYAAFLTAGLMFWVRFNGIIVLIIISILYFYNSNYSKKQISKFLLALFIFILVISPTLIQRYDQFGDPLYFSQSNTIFLENYVSVVAENTNMKNYSASDYIDDNGILSFFDKFVLNGIFNIIQSIYKILFPYMLVLFPIGVFFSIRAFDQSKKFLKSNWIWIFASLGIFLIYFSIVPEKRLLYFLIPNLILFSVIPIERLIKYGFSTFSFSKNQKNISFIIIISIILILSIVYTSHYELTDKQTENEKLQFSEIINKKLDGKILDAGYTLQSLMYITLNESGTNFKEFGISEDVNNWWVGTKKLNVINLYATDFENFILVSRENNLNYVSINKNGVNMEWYPYLKDVYDNENNFPELKKIFDSQDSGFENFHVKIFEIRPDDSND
tara:strand:+ start:10513 stop:12162 length:1650 start_codon:yes stop_codon:yes gene_type:complete